MHGARVSGKIVVNTMLSLHECIVTKRFCVCICSVVVHITEAADPLF